MEISPERPIASKYFWIFYAGTLLILSLGCVAGDQNVEIGEIGVCGTGSEQWGEGRGDAGYLAFYHPLNAQDLSSHPPYFQFNPFLVEGSFGTFYVSHWSTGEPARVVKVTSSDPSILAVAPIHQSNQVYFDVDAIRPGTVELTVETALGAADRLQLTVTDLASVDIYHCCTSSSRAMYLTDSEVEIPVTYFSSYGETPQGFGWLPFEISDESRLEWLSDAADPADIHLKTGARAGTVTLRPRVSGKSITVELVEPEQIDGISVHWEPDRAAAGQWLIGAVLYRDDTAICAGKYPMRATSKTPRVCRFVDPEGYSVDWISFHGDQTTLLQQLGEGECELNVELLDKRGREIKSQTSTKDLEYYGSRRDSDPYY